MRRAIFGHWPPTSGACITTFLLTTVLLSLVADAAPSNQLEIRHEDHDDSHGHHASHPDIMGMVDGGMHMGNDGTTTSLSSAIATPSAMPMHDPHSGHSHGSHTPAKTILDDADIHYWHSFPPSYLAADFRLDNDSAIFGEEFDETWDPENASGHLGLVVLHAAGFYTAYFGLLPIALALRAADHDSHYLVNAAFLVLATLGWLAGAAYNTSTPDRYEGSSYPTFVNILLLGSFTLAVIDSLHLIRRAISLWKSGNRSWSDFRRILRNDSDQWLPHKQYEMVGLVESESARPSEEGQAIFTLGEEEEDGDDVREPRTLANSVPTRRPSLLRQWSPPSRQSTASEGTLHESSIGEAPNFSYNKQSNTRVGAYDAPESMEQAPASREEASSKMGAARFLQIVLTWARRFQVVFAYVTLLIGITTYTGMCRGSYVNSCAAHYIKGSIFFGYGLLTFARYLGAYADLGWAWNRHTGSKRGVSAEMVECAVIFIYGITNTWLERLGAKHGDPYTVKQVQHISIAVMFWFAGLSGILLESKTMRRVLGAVRGGRADRTEPLSYAFSFNPLPALVIAVTGLAMAAHHQTYVFQVQIHSLWGTLLAGGSAFRFLTYFFLWLRPPTDSTLPSRPPTEVLTSFGYAAGGIVFMLSNEEIAFAAMRAGYDDMMAFLNFTIALTSLIFCWTVVVMGFKGWGVLRLQGKEAEAEVA